MEISVLGPFRATLSGVPVHLTAVKPRKVFALLALQAGQVVSVASLVEEVWGESPPRSVQTTLQTYILQIRNAIAAVLGDDATGEGAFLPNGAKSVLVTEPGGYRLDVHGDSWTPTSSTPSPRPATVPWTGANGPTRPRTSAGRCRCGTAARSPTSSAGRCSKWRPPGWTSRG